MVPPNFWDSNPSRAIWVSKRCPGTTHFGPNLASRKTYVWIVLHLMDIYISKELHGTWIRCDELWKHMEALVWDGNYLISGAKVASKLVAFLSCALPVRPTSGDTVVQLQQLPNMCCITSYHILPPKLAFILAQRRFYDGGPFQPMHLLFGHESHAVGIALPQRCHGAGATYHRFLAVRIQPVESW